MTATASGVPGRWLTTVAVGELRKTLASSTDAGVLQVLITEALRDLRLQWRAHPKSFDAEQIDFLSRLKDIAAALDRFAGLKEELAQVVDLVDYNELKPELTQLRDELEGLPVVAELRRSMKSACLRCVKSARNK